MFNPKNNPPQIGDLIMIEGNPHEIKKASWTFFDPSTITIEKENYQLATKKQEDAWWLVWTQEL